MQLRHRPILSVDQVTLRTPLNQELMDLTAQGWVRLKDAVDPIRQVVTDARLDGVPPSVRKAAKKLEIPVTDPLSPEGLVLLQGKPLLISDVRAVWDRLHPHNRKLALLTGTKSLMVVPLKTKDRILGCMIVERRRERSLTEDDLELMITFAHVITSYSIHYTKLYESFLAYGLTS